MKKSILRKEFVYVIAFWLVFEEGDFSNNVMMPQEIVEYHHECKSYGIVCLVYGKSFDEIEQIFDGLSQSVHKRFLSFADEVSNGFGKEYLKIPAENDLKRIKGINANRGIIVCEERLE